MQTKKDLENIKNEVYNYVASKGQLSKPKCLKKIKNLVYEYDFIDSRIDILIE